ncbi:hypothetical protein WA158_008420 [Blastocystis sp. Blastoise]
MKSIKTVASSYSNNIKLLRKKTQPFRLSKTISSNKNPSYNPKKELLFSGLHPILHHTSSTLQSQYMNTISINNQKLSENPQIHKSNGHQKNNKIKPHLFCFNLSNHLLPKYNLFQVIDRGFKKDKWTSYRLKSDVIYFDTIHHRYEICRLPKDHPDYIPRKAFKISQIKDKYSHLHPIELKTVIPLPESYYEKTINNLCWSDFQWTLYGLELKGKRYTIRALQFISRTNPVTSVSPIPSYLDSITYEPI